FEDENFKIYPSFGKLRLFKQGVLIHESTSDKNSLFSYDVRNADINELREFRGSVQYPIFEAISRANKEVVTMFLEQLKEEHIGAEIDFGSLTWSHSQKSEAWKECLQGIKIIQQKAIDDIKSRGVQGIDTASMLVVPKKIYNWLSKTVEGSGA